MSFTMRQKQASFNRARGPRAVSDSGTGVRARIAHGSEKLDSAVRRGADSFVECPVTPLHRFTVIVDPSSEKVIGVTPVAMYGSCQQPMPG
jgi:hypothetical protein